MRKERPRVRVTQRTEAHSGKTQVSCLATGFYPRRI
ncbi:major histocompatibility complex class I-related gene protein-like, partial [Arapaima gigas]